MDYSIFLHGKYYATEVLLQYKYSFSNKKINPYALKFVPLKNKHDNTQNVPFLWDISCFRPDFRKDVNFAEGLANKKGMKVTVLYENANCDNGACYKIPRYIFANDKWYVNVR